MTTSHGVTKANQSSKGLIMKMRIEVPQLTESLILFSLQASSFLNLYSALSTFILSSCYIVYPSSCPIVAYHISPMTFLNWNSAQSFSPSVPAGRSSVCKKGGAHRPQSMCCNKPHPTADIHHRNLKRLIPVTIRINSISFTY